MGINPFMDTSASSAATVAKLDTSASSAATVAKLDTSASSAATVAEVPEIKGFKEDVNMNQVACATPPIGVGANLDIGGVDTSASTAGTLACAGGCSSSGGSSGGGTSSYS